MTRGNVTRHWSRQWSFFGGRLILEVEYENLATEVPEANPRLTRSIDDGSRVAAPNPKSLEYLKQVASRWMGQRTSIPRPKVPTEPKITSLIEQKKRTTPADEEKS